MPLDRHARRLLDAVALGAPAEGASVTADERRRSFRALMALGAGPAPACAVAGGAVPGPAGPLRLRVYTPPELDGVPSPGLVFFHGGGGVAGDLDTHDALCRRLATRGGVRVAAVDYRLAPEHRFPAALDDALAATRALARTAAAFAIDPARLGVGGDSGGGTLAAAVALASRDAGGPKLCVLLLLCPVLDQSNLRPSRHLYGRGYLLDRATMERDLGHVLPPDLDPADPRVSPLRADRLGGLPPVLIHSAEFDPLRDEAADYAARLRAAGVSVRHTCHPGMIHHFLALDRFIPAAQPALDQVGAELAQAFA